MNKDLLNFRKSIIKHSFEQQLDYITSLNILLQTEYKQMCNLELEEVAFIMNISKEEVLQIETLVLKKLKDPKIAVKLLSFTSEY